MGAISRYCELSDFYGFDLKSSSRAVTCAFCRPHLPKVLRTLQFFNGANRALAAVWCVFCRPDLPKVPRPCREKPIFDQKLSLQSRALFGRDRGPHPRKQRPSGDPEGHFTRKNNKAAPVKFVRNPEVFELNFLWLERIVLHGYSLCICTWFWMIWIRNCAL